MPTDPATDGRPVEASRMGTMPILTDERILAAVAQRTDGAFTFWVRNVLASELGVQRFALPVPAVRRLLIALERKGAVVCRRWGPGCHNEWRLADAGKEEA